MLVLRGGNADCVAAALIIFLRRKKEEASHFVGKVMEPKFSCQSITSEARS